MSSLRLFYLGPINSPHLEDFATAMRERGHAVYVGGDLWGGGLPQESGLPGLGVPVREITQPAFVWMRRVLRELKPDVVHAHWMPFARVAALAGARPLVATAWGSDVYQANRHGRLMMRFALRRTDVALADSADLLSRLRELGPRSLRTMLVNWGVDLDSVRVPTEAERDEAKARLGLGAGPVVLSARGLKEIYNPDVIVDAFAQVRAALPEAQLVLKHSGTDEMLRDEWRGPGIHVIGRVEAKTMVELFRAAEVTVSIPRRDSSPRSVWEAMAAGSATVLSDLAWVNELIEDRRDALVVPPIVDEVAAAIQCLLSDQELRTGLTESARRLVERHRNRESELDRVEACYRELAARR